jgi:hypothetical protein
VCETDAPEGYALDVSQYEVEVASSVASHIDATDMPQRSQVALVIQKTDEATGKDQPQGGATLEGAQFEVCYFDGIHGEDDLPRTPTRTWILATDATGQALLDEAHLVSGDELFRDDSGPVLPLGTVSIREVKAPRGYLIDPRVAVVHVDGSGEETYVERFAAQGAPERVIRGDFDLVKVHGQSMERLAGIPFKVTSETTGESHVIVTDENGYASTAASWNPHSQNTNGNDWLLEAQGDDATAPEKAPDPAAGIWFGTDAPVVPPTSTDVLYTAIARQTPELHEPAGGWYPEQRMSRADALRAYSLGSAMAVGRERELGALAPGMLADIAVWDTNFLTCSMDEVQEARCLTTHLGA